MNKKIVSTVALIAIIGVGVKFYTAPMSTLGEIRDGFLNKDADLVSTHVDYETLKKNVKEKMLLKLAKKEENIEKKGFARLGSMMASTMVDKMLNTYLNPTGLKMAMQKNNEKTKLFDGVTYDGSFKDADTFSIVLHKEGKEDVSGTMKRVGLFEWKVVDIDMPEDKNK